MYAFKWHNLHTRMLFGPDDGGVGGSEAATPTASSGGGDGGGAASAPSAPTPSPSAAPAAPAPSAPQPTLPGTPPSVPEPPSAPMDWSNLGSADDLDYIEITAQPPAPKEVPQPPPEPPREPPPKEEPTPPPPAEPPAPPQPQAQSAAPLSAADPWRIAEGLEQNRDAVMAHLATSKFALSEAEMQEIDTDVMAAIPKLLSRVFLESQISMQKFLAQSVPGMVRRHNAVSDANGAAEKKFFDTHKALDINNPQHRSTAVRIATVYRQANPQIPLDQLIQEVGPMVMTALRVNAPPPQPAAPATRAAATAAAFRPAVNGGGGVSPTPDPGNPWEGLGRNYDEG